MLEIIGNIFLIGLVTVLILCGCVVWIIKSIIDSLR